MAQPLLMLCWGGLRQTVGVSLDFLQRKSYKGLEQPSRTEPAPHMLLLDHSTFPQGTLAQLLSSMAEEPAEATGTQTSHSPCFSPCSEYELAGSYPSQPGICMALQQSSMQHFHFISFEFAQNCRCFQKQKKITSKINKSTHNNTSALLNKDFQGSKNPTNFKCLQSIWSADNGCTQHQPATKSPRKENMGKVDL